VDPTVIELLTVKEVTTVVPLSRFADADLPVPGVKPAPEKPTFTPVIAWEAARVMLGAAKIVRVAEAVLPDASVTAIVTVPGAVVDGIIMALFAGTLPEVSEVTVVAFVKGETVKYQVIGDPLKANDRAEDAAYPCPLIVTVDPDLTAVEPSVIMG